MVWMRALFAQLRPLRSVCLLTWSNHSWQVSLWCLLPQEGFWFWIKNLLGGRAGLRSGREHVVPFNRGFYRNSWCLLQPHKSGTAAITRSPLGVSTLGSLFLSPLLCFSCCVAAHQTLFIAKWLVFGAFALIILRHRSLLIGQIFERCLKWEEWGLPMLIKN